MTILPQSKYSLAAVLAVMSLFFSVPSYSDIVVIVNAKNSVSSISKSDLNRIFLGKKSEFGNGQKAIPVNQYYSSDIRAKFDKQFLRKSPQQSKAYWSKQLFTGAGKPPMEMPGDLDVLQEVAKNEDMIGYVDSSALNESVKVLTVK